MPTPTLDQLRIYAIARSLFKPTTLPKALNRLGFVQADPIRAPARAQDLTLRHRVAGYRAGDLEARYARLDIEEDFFVNYGFLPRATQALMPCSLARAAASSFSLSPLRATSTRLKPARANCLASASPIPDEAPVIRVVWSVMVGVRVMVGSESPAGRRVVACSPSAPWAQAATGPRG